MHQERNLLTKRPTRSTIQTFPKQQKFDLQTPYNQQSSDAESNQARYLSHLIESETSSFSFSNSYWQNIYRCAIYVKKQNLITKIDDMLLLEQLNQHIQMTIHPESKDATGEKLLKNGYILAAYALLLARIYASNFVFNYLVGLFEGEYYIEFNKEQFDHIKCIGSQYIPKQSKVFPFKKLGLKRLMPADELLYRMQDNDSQI